MSVLVKSRWEMNHTDLRPSLGALLVAAALLLSSCTGRNENSGLPSPPAPRATSDSPSPGSEPAPGVAQTATYQGNVWFGVAPASDPLVGAKVEAIIANRVCIWGKILPAQKQGSRVVTPYSPLAIGFGGEPAIPGEQACGRPQAVIFFLIDRSRLAAETATWSLGPHRLDLHWPAVDVAPDRISTRPTFVGTATTGGRSARDGTVVKAFVGSNLCGMATTRDGAYDLFLHSLASMPGCAQRDDQVIFTVDGRTAPQTGVFQRVDQNLRLDLSS